MYLSKSIDSLLINSHGGSWWSATYLCQVSNTKKAPAHLLCSDGFGRRTCWLGNLIKIVEEDAWKLFNELRWYIINAEIQLNSQRTWKDRIDRHIPCRGRQADHYDHLGNVVLVPLLLPKLNNLSYSSSSVGSDQDPPTTTPSFTVTDLPLFLHWTTFDRDWPL